MELRICHRERFFVKSLYCSVQYHEFDTVRWGCCIVADDIRMRCSLKVLFTMIVHIAEKYQFGIRCHSPWIDLKPISQNIPGVINFVHYGLHISRIKTWKRKCHGGCQTVEGNMRLTSFVSSPPGTAILQTSLEEYCCMGGSLGHRTQHFTIVIFGSMQQPPCGKEGRNSHSKGDSDKQQPYYIMLF